MKELKKNLEEKALKALQYINKNEILKETLRKLNDKYVANKNVVSLIFYQKALKNCFYGLANRVLNYNFH